MSNLVNQPSAKPTRKVTAAVVGAALVEVTRVVLSNVAPTWADPAMFVALTPLVVFACGWIVKERA